EPTRRRERHCGASPIQTKITQSFAFRHLPKVGTAENSYRRGQFAVRRESHPRDPLFGSNQSVYFLARGHIPKSGCAIFASRQDEPAVRRKRGAIHLT